MTEDKGIPIRNIFYMLSYAFQALKREDFKSVSDNIEKFSDIADLFAEILCIGLSYQLKQGLYRNYVNENECLSVLRGKIDINGTIRNKIACRNRLQCDYDNYSENNIYNQILKSTIWMLMKMSDVNNDRKAKIKKLFPFLVGINLIDCRAIRWNTLIFHRTNKNYEMLINLCRIFWQDSIMNTDDGNLKMTMFSDKNMAKLYEKFILEYYRRHHPELSPASKEIKWAFSDDNDKNLLWPNMLSDVYLTNQGKTLIIDAKYYSKALSEHYDKLHFHSHNLYQIYTYINNAAYANADSRNQEMSGMLLYAKTSEMDDVDEVKTFKDGKKIYVKTLDLNKEFEEIAKQLENIVGDCFENCSTTN